MAPIYQFKENSHAPHIEAQAAGEELERIRTFNNGRLESRMVVEAARPEDSPLHPAFEWDDVKAAEAWRVEQARHLIRVIEVVVEKADGGHAPTRAFVSVVRDTDRSYTSTAHALTDLDLRRQVLDSAWQELEAWRRRHAELIEFAKIFADIDEARDAK